MGRIEEALAKMQAGNKAPPPSRPIGRVTPRPETGAPPAHTYGGKRIEIDLAELRTQGLLAPDAQQQRLVDQYRAIKRPLLRNASATHEPPLPNGNLLMVGSAFAGEGKTFTCINLCLSIAREQDWSVVLVDGDSLKPHLTKLFGATEEPGLMDLLKDSTRSFDSVVMETSVPRFAVVPAGKYDEQASEFLASGRMSALCAEIATSDRQRIVVFDSAPLLQSTESPVIASQVGQVILVVRANRTLRKAVLEARDKIDPSKAVSLLLNQADSGDTASTYGDYPAYGA
jgi:protein-tyrosine kinase